jgi:hypothetical protein
MAFPPAKKLYTPPSFEHPTSHIQTEGSSAISSRAMSTRCLGTSRLRRFIHYSPIESDQRFANGDCSYARNAAYKNSAASLVRP